MSPLIYFGDTGICRNIYISIAFYKLMATMKLSEEEFRKSLAEARKDQTFLRDIRKFIKITAGIYKLKDYGMEN